MSSDRRDHSDSSDRSSDRRRSASHSPTREDDRKRRHPPEASPRKKFHHSGEDSYSSSRDSSRGGGGSRPQTSDDSRRASDEPGPSGQGGQSSRFQGQSQQSQQHQPRQPAQTWRKPEEPREEGDFDVRMSGLNVGEEEVWGQGSRKGGRAQGAWGQSQPQPSTSQQQAPPPVRQQGWPRPTHTQPRVQPQQSQFPVSQPPQSQFPVSQPPQSQFPVSQPPPLMSGVSGAWARGPPQDLQRQGQGQSHSQGQGYSQGPGHVQGYSQGPGQVQGYSQGPGQVQGYSQGPGQVQGYSQGPGHVQGYSHGPGQVQGYSHGPGQSQVYSQGPGQGQVYSQGPGQVQVYSQGPGQAQGYSQGQDKSKQPVPEKSSPSSETVGEASGGQASGEPHPEETKKKRHENRPLPETLQSSDYMDFAPRIFANSRSGRFIDVHANFFPLRLEDYNITVFHYDLVFEPDVPKALLRRAWNSTSEVHFPKRITVFDGMSNVYTKGPLVSGATFRADLTLYHPDSNRSKDYTMMLKEVRRIPMNGLRDYREKIKKSQTMDARKKALPLAEVSVIEVILKNWPANNLIQHNRVFFPKGDMQPRTCPLSDRLELRYGYFQSAFLGHKLYLNFDVAHRPFYRSDYIRNLVRDCRGRINIEDTSHFLKGAKVEYALPDDRRMKITYRANKMVGDAISQTFERDGESMTVAEYFQREKDFKLRFPNLPLLWVGPTTKTIYLPLECVRLVEDQIYRGALNAGETRKMVTGATTDARRRKMETIQAFARGKFNDNPYLKEFGISVSRDMETVRARVLEPPKLKTTTVVTVKEGAWKTRSFLDAKSFNRWCIVNLDKDVDRNSLVNLQRSLQAKAKEFNMNIGEPAISCIDKGGTASYFELQKIFSNLKGMTIVIVVIADTKGLYSKVKTICETQEGILTQCIRGKNVSADARKIMTTLDNLVLKINAKLGGTNHSLNRSSTPPCLEGYVMVVGADVTHAGPGSKIPSVAAVAVCSEISAFQYSITIRVQHGEIIQDLREIMRINLHNFCKQRRRFPEKIFFFRDGVSEGEMEKVLKTEFRAVKEACDGVGCASKITLLVVQKRHHTRFFPTASADEEGKTFNVPVGTCVDSDIVHPGGLDFYLLSHGSLLGTARPTRYRLLHDDNRLTDDELEQLTFYLCHLYARCNRSVSYPSPTYNAHLAAFRARAYLEGLNLTDKEDLKQIQAKLKDAISATYPMFFV